MMRFKIRTVQRWAFILWAACLAGCHGNPIEKGPKMEYDFVDNFASAKFKADDAKTSLTAALYKIKSTQGDVRAILTPSPGEVAFNPGYTAKINSYLEFIPLVHPDSVKGTDFVKFAVFAIPRGKRPIKIYDQRLYPRSNPEDRTFIKDRVPLDFLAGQQLDFVFATAPRSLIGDSHVFQVMWIEPKLKLK